MGTAGGRVGVTVLSEGREMSTGIATKAEAMWSHAALVTVRENATTTEGWWVALIVNTTTPLGVALRFATIHAHGVHPPRRLQTTSTVVPAREAEVVVGNGNIVVLVLVVAVAVGVQAAKESTGLALETRIGRRNTTASTGKSDGACSPVKRSNSR